MAEKKEWHPGYVKAVKRVTLTYEDGKRVTLDGAGYHRVVSNEPGRGERGEPWLEHDIGIREV